MMEVLTFYVAIAMVRPTRILQCNYFKILVYIGSICYVYFTLCDFIQLCLLITYSLN